MIKYETHCKCFAIIFNFIWAQLTKYRELLFRAVQSNQVNCEDFLKQSLEYYKHKGLVHTSTAPAPAGKVNIYCSFLTRADRPRLQHGPQARPPPSPRYLFCSVRALNSGRPSY